MRFRSVGGGEAAAITSVFFFFACLSPLAHVHLSHHEADHPHEQPRAQSIYHVHLGGNEYAREGEGLEESAKGHQGEALSVAPLRVSARYSVEPSISVTVSAAETATAGTSPLDRRYESEIQTLPHGPPTVTLKPLRAPPLLLAPLA